MTHNPANGQLIRQGYFAERAQDAKARMRRLGSKFIGAGFKAHPFQGVTFPLSTRSVEI